MADSGKLHSYNKSKKYKILLIIVAILVVIRLILPYIVLHFANRTLANMSGYFGHIDDIDISLYRGAYQINDMYLNKKDSITGKQTDFFKVKTIDLSVHWKSLLNGKLVGELTFASPVLIFTKDKTEIGQVKKDTNDFRKILKDFMPLKVNRFEVNTGKLTYADFSTKPKVDISFTNLYVLAQNLTNASDEKSLLPSTVTATATAYEGTASFNMKLNALAEKTTFDLNAELKNTNLVLLNDFFKAYGNFDVNKGSFGLYTEFASKDGKYKGYVKPLLKDLGVIGKEDKNDAFLQKVWETVVGGASVILTNRKKDQVATKVPIEGNYNGSHTDIIETIFELLRNAFIQALMPSIDNQINIGSVDEDTGEKKGLLKRLFEGDSEKKKKQNKKEGKKEK